MGSYAESTHWYIRILHPVSYHRHNTQHKHTNGSYCAEANGCFDAKGTNEIARIPALLCPTPSICS